MGAQAADDNPPMGTRLMSLLIWAAVLATAVAWGLPLFTRSTPVPADASLAAATAPAGAGLARLLGQPPVAPVVEQAPLVADSRFQLLGVVAPGRAGASGLALISVDGKPARAVGVGRELEPGLRLLSVGHRQVALGAAAGAPSVTLTLPALAEAQRGRLGDGQPTLAMPRMAPGGLPGGFPGGVMRVPPLTEGAPLPLPPVQIPQGTVQGQADTTPGSMPYQPESHGNPTAGQPQPGNTARMR